MYSCLRPVGLALATFSLVPVATSCGDADVSPADGADAVSEVDQSGPSAESSASESADSDTDLPSHDDILAYFNAVSTGNVEQLTKAIKLAEKGSIAEAYAGYLRASANASIDGGTPYPDGPPIKETDRGWESCDETGECVTWSDVQGRDGKIVSFKVNGNKLNNRLAAGTGEPVPAGDLGSVKLLYAYKAVSGSELVVVEVRSFAAPIVVESYGATYRSPSGRQITAGENSGPTELAGKSSATVVMSFQDAQPGGVVTMSLLSADFTNEQPVVLRTK